MAGAGRGWAAVGLVAAWSAAPALAASTAAVTIQNFAYSPAAVQVRVGDSVRWTNRDSAPHTATARDGTWTTGRLDQDQSGAVRFDRAGTFAYTCDFHASMQGTVVVNEAEATTTSSSTTPPASTASTNTPGSTGRQGQSRAPAAPATTETTTTLPAQAATTTAPAGPVTAAAEATPVAGDDSGTEAAPALQPTGDGDGDGSVAGPGAVAALALAATAVAAYRRRGLA